MQVKAGGEGMDAAEPDGEVIDTSFADPVNGPLNVAA